MGILESLLRIATGEIFDGSEQLVLSCSTFGVSQRCNLDMCVIWWNDWVYHTLNADMCGRICEWCG
jgi:hypothetical protein